MVLRRVVTHLKAQHWTAVALDFAIVVIGVFIGIQVSNWNNMRQEDQRAVQVLTELDQEFVGIDQAARSLASFYERSLRNEAVLLKSLAAGKVDPADAKAVSDAVALGLVYGDPPPPSGTYRDLLSSGNLALVRDKALRIKLIEYDQSIDNVAKSDTNIQVGLAPFYPAFIGRMTVLPGADSAIGKTDEYFVDYDFAAVKVDIAKMFADPAFAVAANQVFLAQQYRLINIRLARSKIAAIRELIRKDRSAATD